MTLTTDELHAFPDVDVATLDRVLEADAFGEFAILAVAQEEYIQAANDWNASDECAKFDQANGSEPWLLEYREGGQHYRASGHVTLEQVRQAFRSYLLGDGAWRSEFTWVAWEL